MGIDISRFHQTFFDESREGLDLMESGLLALDPAAADHEVLDGIFRAAHSIKGGAGTFGFQAIADFTHDVETTLDLLRTGELSPSRELVDVLLETVDVVRDLLAAAQTGEAADTEALTRVQAALNRFRSPAAGTPAATAAPPTPPAAGWEIEFAPYPDLFVSGNDPLRLLRELETLGELQVRAELDALPPLAELDPEVCYLRWHATLAASCPREAVEEIFAWVEDRCDLKIKEIAPATPARDPAAAKRGAVVPATESSSLRVDVRKIDTLINLVGELVINQAMLKQEAEGLDPVRNEALLNGLSQLDLNTRQLQEAVMATRMVPVDFVFSRFPRVVRDLAGKLEKNVRLETRGEGTELDRGVIENITDPLNHIVRNSLDHGIETPAEREAAGKDPEATLTLQASHEGGHIVIVVRDDGRGMDRERILGKARESGLAAPDSLSDREVWQLIFAPGFSTAAEVTDVSGRGVGMDVVKRNIEGLGGQVEVSSTPGAGTEVMIRLPLTLAILDGMSVAVGDDIYIVPLHSVIESLQPAATEVRRLAGNARVVRVRDEFVPLLPLAELFDDRAGPVDPARGIFVVVESGGRRAVLLVDELVGQQQVVIKSLEANYRRVSGVAGATILGDGRVALILDIGDLVQVGERTQAA